MTPIPLKNGKGFIKSEYYKIKVDGRAVDLHRHMMERHLGRKLLRSEHVHHRDGDKHNNRLENLEILCSSEHIRHHRPLRPASAWTEDQRKAHRQIHDGEKSPFAKLSNAQAVEIRRRASAGENCRKLAREFGVCHSRISQIKHGKAFKNAL